MFKKTILMLALVFSFSIICFGDEDGSIYGWRAEGTFIVSNFNSNNRNIENNIIHGEAFLFSSDSYSEYTLLFYLKSGGKIDIKFYQDKPINEQTLFREYVQKIESLNINNLKIDYAKRLLINGHGIFREFDKNSQLIKETRFNNAQGIVTIGLKVNSQTQGNNSYTFSGEGVYKLISDSEIIEITITVNSQY